MILSEVQFSKIDRLILKKLSSESDASTLMPILEETFGSRQSMAEHVSKWLSDKQFSVITALLGRHTIGLSVARIESPEKLKSYSQFGPEVEKLFQPGLRLGSFQTLAVTSEFRRAGIGEKLSLHQLEWMKTEKCKAALGVAWNHGTADTSEHLFRKAGFTKISEAKDFYYEGSIRSSHHCPICQGICHCSATLYAKFFEE